MQIEPLGDRALLLTLDDAPRAAAVAEAIRAAQLPWVADVVPAFDRVAIHLRWHGLPAHDDSTAAERPLHGHRRDAQSTTLHSIAARAVAASRVDARTIELPVHYDGPDLRELASALKLTPDELVARHAAATYTVLAVGFTPGFAYLGGLPPELHAPRRPTPRPRVEPGSVAIGGPYTGVYPSATPGGWHLIGRTDAPLFDLARNEPALLRVGDRVRFVPIAAQLPPPLPRAGGEGRGEGAETRPADARSSVNARHPERSEGSGVSRSSPDAARREILRFAQDDVARQEASESATPPTRRRGSIAVLAPGTHTTIQDLGRPGHRAAGVPVGGAVDSMGHAVANALVGNDADAATIECALVGPRLRFDRDAIVAIAGARVAGLPYARPFRVARGEVLSLERIDRGTYAYLAIAGGIDAPRVLGSRATDARLGIGRPLAKGDAIAVGKPTRRVILRDGWRAGIDGWYGDEPIRFLRGDDATALDATTFEVSARSDRMGVRLTATPPLATRVDASRPSVPVTVGTIQATPDGNAIVLLADAQTIGGYAVAGHVIAVDLPRLAQRRPGENVHFIEVTLDEADALSRRRERDLAMLRYSVARATSP